MVFSFEETAAGQHEEELLSEHSQTNQRQNRLNQWEKEDKPGHGKDCIRGHLHQKVHINQTVSRIARTTATGQKTTFKDPGEKMLHGKADGCHTKRGTVHD